MGEESVNLLVVSKYAPTWRYTTEFLRVLNFRPVAFD